MALRTVLLSAFLSYGFASPYLVERTPGDGVDPLCVNDNVLRALQNPTRTAGSYPFCSSYIGHGSASTKYKATITVTVPVVTAYFSSHHTITTTFFSNLQRYDEQTPLPSPITYPTPQPAPTITLTGSVPAYVAPYLPSRISSACSCLTPLPSQIATVASTLTVTVGRSTTHITNIDDVSGPYTTYAAFCNPSIFLRNAFSTAVPSRAVRTILPTPIVAQKADCCQICADTPNCVYWSYGPGGKCKIVYGTDVKPVDKDGNTPASCPNGIASGGFSGLAANDALTVYSPGQCASEQGGLFQSDMVGFDQCEVWGGVYCDACAVYGGDSCA